MTNKFFEHKSAHIVGFLAVVAIGLSAIWHWPNLKKDEATALGTLGTFATFYGVIFALIELSRTKNAATQAADEARKAYKAVTRVVTTERIVECVASAQNAVACIEAASGIPAATITQIIRTYSELFATQLRDPDSSHRKNRSTLQAYFFNKAKPGPNSYVNTREALLAMVGDLGEFNAANKNFPEHS